MDNFLIIFAVMLILVSGMLILVSGMTMACDTSNDYQFFFLYYSNIWIVENIYRATLSPKDYGRYRTRTQYGVEITSH